MTRTFDDRPAVRESTPLLLGFVGPSGTGKTFSMLRVAAGIQRITGGDIFVGDTEARRALHYADRFKFRHVPFGAPFGPLDYLAMYEHCIKKGAKIILTDSLSHEHEGPGGVLEMHAAETKRLAALWKVREDKAQMSAWNKPKSERSRAINSMMQMDAQFLFGFRAKPKLKIVKGREPEQRGFMPIAGDDWVYEMTARFLLKPGADGRPTMQNETEYEGEQEIIKIPDQFRNLFAQPRQLDEKHGEDMALWAKGEAAPEVISPDDLVARYAACSDDATYRTLENSRRLTWSKTSKSDKERLKDAAESTARRLAEAARFSDTETIGNGEVSPDEEPPMREPGDDSFAGAAQ